MRGQELEGAARRAGERSRKPSGRRDLHVAGESGPHLFEPCVVFRTCRGQVKGKEINLKLISTTWSVLTKVSRSILEGPEVGEVAQ